VSYRKTLMVRLTSSEALPRPARLQALTDAVNRTLTVRLHWGEPAEDGIHIEGDEHLRFEAFNGEVLQVRPLQGLTAGAANPAAPRRNRGSTTSTKRTSGTC
jgi:hypothetical protein